MEQKQIQAHVAPQKKKIVKEIVDLINQYPIIGIVNMENLPAPQLQVMRATLREGCYMTMTKKRLMRIAIEQAKGSKKGVEQLEKYLRGMPAMIFTKENPFKLSKTLQKAKSPAPAKAGQTAPNDIVIPAGPTPFAPGPIIGELSMIGVKSGVEGGKVAVKENSTVAKEGEKIKPKVAEILTRLNIQPMEVGLDLMAVFEDGLIYEKSILSIDEKEYLDNLTKASKWAFNLACFAAIPNKETIEVLIQTAQREAKGLGVSQNIIDSEIIDELVGKAEQQMNSLKSTANIADAPASEEKPAESKEAPKAEEKKEEPKAEEKAAEAKPEEKKE